jgi:hypothetical protein
MSDHIGKATTMTDHIGEATEKVRARNGKGEG